MKVDQKYNWLILVFVLALAAWNWTNAAKTTPSLDKEATIYSVIRVVDGDTVEVRRGDIKVKLRLIGVNAPESVDPRRAVECFGREASDYTKKLLTGQDVRLAADPSQDDKDKYGRWLRYVYLLDGTLVNQQLISEGYGYEYTYKVPYKYQREFKAAEAAARERQKGLWADRACGLKNISTEDIKTTNTPIVKPTELAIKTPLLTSAQPLVKRSSGNVCHERGVSVYYDTVKTFTAFNDLAACLQSGGRLPK